MPITDCRQPVGAIGPLKHMVEPDVSAADYEDARGFVVAATAAGDVAVRTLEGDADLTVSGLDAGDVVGVGGVPVLCRAVRTAGTTATVRIGFL